MFGFLKKKSRLYCFTPEVMVATVLVESALALYVFLHHRTTLFGRIAGAILVLLAFFQAAEYYICAGSNTFMWAQIGFVATTFLPVLGYHLISIVLGEGRFLKLGYALAFLFSIYFVFGPNTLTEPVCTGNYIIFHTAQKLSWLFSVYYFGFLFAGIVKAVRRIRESAQLGKKEDALFFIVAGYLSFIVPMAIVLATLDFAMNTIPSIMCGFAVIFALLLALKVVPAYQREHVSGSGRHIPRD